jgi:PAS domain S-box-containing protein
MYPCFKGILHDASARIIVDGEHIANWFIGQVRTDMLNEEQVNGCADSFGVKRDVFIQALKEVPIMSDEQFNKVTRMLFAFIGELTEKASSILALQNERLLLRTLIDNIPDSIYSKDLSCRKTLANLAEVRYMGAKSESDVIGKDDFDFYPKELAEKFFADDQSVMLFGKPVLNREEYILDDMGQKRWLLSSKLPLRDKDNQIVGLVGIGRDITEWKSVEEKLQKAEEKTEESHQLKKAFLDTIAHEIRLPFSQILGFLSVLQNEGLTGSQKEEDINLLNQSSYRLMNTLNDIIEISQIQTGQMKPVVSEINIVSLIENITDRFNYEANIKGLKFSVNNDLPQSIEIIYTDEKKINSILFNLISNAIKFTNTGAIELGVQLVSAPTNTVEKQHVLEFFVNDTGIGIPASKHQAIFEKFVQADYSIARPFEGSGLGLSIAKAYVEMLGGGIFVESEEGKGSTFRFTIPVNLEAAENASLEKPDMEKVAGNQIKPLKILIAEDDEGSAYVITMAVKMFGKEVIRVRTGVEAVEACRNNADIDLVMMDIKMPEMDGDEAARQIRQFNTDVIIIAQTAYAMTVDRKMVIDSGCNDYITKPIKKDNLIVMVQNHFRKQE